MIEEQIEIASQVSMVDDTDASGMKEVTVASTEMESKEPEAMEVDDQVNNCYMYFKILFKKNFDIRP